MTSHREFALQHRPAAGTILNDPSCYLLRAETAKTTFTGLVDLGDSGVKELLSM